MAIELFVAEVGRVDSDGSVSFDGVVHYPNDENLDTWEVRFNMPSIFGNIGDTLPRAVPLYPHVAQPKNGDKILVIRFDSELDEFGYLPLDISNQVQIRNGHNIIDLTDKNKIKLGIIDNHLSKNQRYYSEIELDKSSINILKYNTTRVDNEADKPDDQKIEAPLTTSIKIDDDSIAVKKYNKSDTVNEKLREDLLLDINGFKYKRTNDNGVEAYNLTVEDNSVSQVIKSISSSASTNAATIDYNEGEISLVKFNGGVESCRFELKDNGNVSIKNTESSSIQMSGSDGSVLINNHLKVTL